MTVKELAETIIMRTDGRLNGIPEVESLLTDWVRELKKNHLKGLKMTRNKMGVRINKEIKSKQQAYWERNQLVCYLSKVHLSWLERHPETDTAWEDDWRTIVLIQTPEGQASWHIHDSEKELFNHLEWRDGNSWDGHTTEEKYARLLKAGIEVK